MQAEHDARQDRATKTIGSFIRKVMHRFVARSWRKWRVETIQLREKEATNRVTVNLGAHQIGRIMSRALAAFRLRSLSMAMRTWIFLVRRYRASQSMQRIVRRILNAKLWRAFRELTVEAGRYRLIHAKRAMIMRSIVQRLLRQAQYRGFNMWVSSVEVKRRQLWERQIEDKQKEHTDELRTQIRTIQENSKKNSNRHS